MKVEQPGQKPKTTYENPLYQAQKAAETVANNAAAAAALEEQAKNNANLQAFMNEMTPEERAAFNAEVNASFSALGNGSGTGLGPGNEVNRNLSPELKELFAKVNRTSAILSRPIGKQPTKEEVEAEFKRLAGQGNKQRRKTRKNHRGGGGCFGGICTWNNASKMGVEQPGTLPATSATVTRENPMSQMNASKTAASTREDLLKRKGELQMSILEKQAKKASYEQKGNQLLVAEMERSIQTTKGMLRNILVLLQALEKAEKQAAVRKADPVAFAEMMAAKPKSQRPVLGAKASALAANSQSTRKNRKTRRTH